METYKLAIVTTHPVQYQVPWFQELARTPELDLTVFYCQIPDERQQGAGFGVSFQWDLPLLEGYRYELLRNVARHPNVERFGGCDTPDIARRLRSGNFDAVIVNGWVVKSCLQTLWACKRSGVPCIVRGESNSLRPRSWWKRVIQHRLIRQYAACLYIGQSNAQFYRERGVSEERLFPTLYFVDNARFASQSSAPGVRATARRRYNIEDDRVAFLFSGKFIPKKHPLELLEAFRKARDAGCKGCLLMVGDGELRARCESLAAEHGLPVRFAGFLNQTEIPAAYAAADCLVLPSDEGETWGLVVNEGMACGLPAIVSDRVGCGPDLVESGVTGGIFSVGDWDALARTLVDFAADPAALRRMGDAARERVSSYSVAATVQGTLDAVRFVVGRANSASWRHAAPSEHGGSA